MTLILEDGTGLEASNAYADLAEFKAHYDLRGVDYSTYADADIEAALITCTIDFMDVYYCYKGTVLNKDQALSLPTDEVGINKDIKNACCNGALLHLKGALLIDDAAVSTTGAIKSTSKKLDVMESETVYQDGTQQTYKRNTATINRLLSGYLFAGGGVQLLRA